MSTQIFTPEVVGVLKRSTITDKLLVLPEQLERNLYLEVNKALNNAGGLWSKKQKGHLFLDDPRTVLGLAIETGQIENKVDDAKAEKKALQAFYTPVELAKRVVELADVSGYLVLEPSVGEGALAKECLAQGCEALTAVDIDPVAIGKFREYVERDTNLAMERTAIYEADFLTIKLRRGDFNRIVMNPPFTRNQDIKHVERALEFLAPGGKLVAIMYPNTARSGFQDLIGRYDYDITDVPAGTFKESGTNIATIILTLRT